MPFTIIFNDNRSIFNAGEGAFGTVEPMTASVYSDESSAATVNPELEIWKSEQQKIQTAQAASDSADAKYLGLPLAIQDAFASKYQVIKTARALGKYQEALDFFDTLTFPAELQPLADSIRVDLANF